MAKKYRWDYNDGEEMHTVSLSAALWRGKAIITIDGTEFNISSRPFSLRGTNQMFRLGETAAMLNFPKKGAPEIVVEGTPLPRVKG